MTALLDRIIALLDENRSLCLDSTADAAVLASRLLPFIEAEVATAVNEVSRATYHRQALRQLAASVAAGLTSATDEEGIPLIGSREVADRAVDIAEFIAKEVERRHPVKPAHACKDPGWYGPDREGDELVWRCTGCAYSYREKVRNVG